MTTKRTQELQKHEADLAQRTNRLRDLDEILKSAEANSDGVAQRQAILEHRLEAVTAAKYSVNSEIEAIKKEFRESQADDKIVDFLKKQKSLEGAYFGTLRQLGSIAELYDVAAGVASNMWGNHVVTNSDTATKLLGLLREHDMGRATVIVLDQVKSMYGDAIDKKFQSPEGTQRLYDLITVKNPLYLPAFYSAVRETLVCDHLSTARKVGLGGAVRYRVVTLKGELVEPQGAMTGGGHGAAGAKLRASHVTMDKEEAKLLLPALQQKLDAATREERQLMQDLHDEREKSKAFSPDQLRKMRQERLMVQNTVDAVRSRVTDLQREAQNNQSTSQRSEVQKELRSAEVALEKAQKDQLAFKLAVEDLESQLEKIGGDEFQEMQREVTSLKKRIAEQEKASTDHKRNAGKFKANRERREADIIEIEKRIQQLQDDASETAKEELKKLTIEIENCVKDIRQKNASKSNLESDISAIRKNMEGLEKELKAAETKKQELELDLVAKRTAIALKQEEMDKLDERMESAVVKVRDNLRDFGLETLHINLHTFLAAVGVLPAGDTSPNTNHRRQKKGGKRQRVDAFGHDDAESDPEVDPRRRSWRERRDDDEDLITMELSDEQLAVFSLKKPETELPHYNIDELREVAKAYNEETRRLRDTIDFEAVKNWKMKNDESKKAKAHYETIVQDFNKMEKQLEALKEERRAAFMATFQIIQTKLREMYQLLANGGDAELQLVETEDPFEGINFVVRPPRKSWKQVGSLSGGEKTLSSLALVFALHHVKPTPIYVLDEIDAALDYANVSIVARYVLQHSIGAQFIIISLRNNMFELAHQLVGICKVKDVTKSLALNPRSLRSLVERKLQVHHASINQSPAPNGGKRFAQTPLQQRGTQQ